MNLIHGLGTHPLYPVWHGMLRRCENPQDSSYRNYGGRGVAVCDEWHDVTTFITWIEANLGPRPEGTTGRKRRYPVYTIDRIDVNGNYEPGNMQWADRKGQASNKRAAEYQVTCPCGQVFTAAARNATYCSRACKMSAENAKKKKQPVEVTCPCGQAFTSTRPWARYCSKSCAQDAERSHQRSRYDRSRHNLDRHPAHVLATRFGARRTLYIGGCG